MIRAYDIYHRHMTYRTFVIVAFHVFCVLAVSLVVLLSLPSQSFALYTDVNNCPDSSAYEFGNDYIKYVTEDGQCLISYDYHKYAQISAGVYGDGQGLGNSSPLRLYHNCQDSEDNYTNCICRRWTGASWDLVPGGANGCITNPYYQIPDEQDLALSTNTIYKTNVPIHNAQSTGIEFNGATGYYAGYARVSIGAFSTVIFTGSGSTVVRDQMMRFDVEWSNLPSQVYNAFFYEDAEETDYVKVIDNYPSGADGSWTFYHSFGYASTYVPYIQLGNQYCTTPTASGCVLYDDTSPAVMVTAPIDYSTYYTNVFTLEQTTDIVAGVPYEYEYILDGDLCVSFSGATLWQDATIQSGMASTGAHLSAQFGTGTIVFQDPYPRSDVMYPKIVVECNDTTQKTVWLGGSMYTSGARPVTFFRSGTVDLPDTWAGGGSEGVFTSAGSGYGLWVEKHTYKKNEPVKFRWRFNTPLTVGSIAFYKEDVASPVILSGSGDITEATFHYRTVEYSSAGEYHPKIRVRSTTYDPEDPATYRDVYLGGGQESDGIEVIRVDDSFFGDTGFSGTNTGSVIFSDQDGIFGIAASAFHVSLDHWYLKPFQVIINSILSALVWLARSGFDLLSSSPIYSTMHDIILPVEGATKTFPSSFFGQEFDFSMLGNMRTFTIDYPSISSDYKWSVYGLQIMVFLSVFWYVIRKFF